MRLATPRMARRATPTYSGLPGIVSSTTASPSWVDTGASVLLLEPGERFLLGSVDLEDLGQTGDLEDPEDAHVLTDEPQVALPFARPLQAADQNAQAGAVQVLDTVQVHDQVHLAAVEEVD